MSEWLTGVIDESFEKGFIKGFAEGYVKGYAKGVLKTLVVHVQKGKISLKTASEELNMSETALCEITGLTIPQST